MIDPGIRQDNTWLVVDPIVGCNNNCQYCFLRIYNKATTKPSVVFSPEEAVDKLVNYWAFGEFSYPMIGSETDVFLCDNSINYLMQFIEAYEKRGIKNPLCISTKCYIPDYFVDFISQKRNVNFIFYLSYSGLPKEIEPHVEISNIVLNFKRLSYIGHKPIHLFRPIMPQNSTIEVFESVISSIAEYADCSVLRGLNLNKELQKLIWFWDDAQSGNFDFSKTVSLWPKGWYERLCQVKSKFPDYPIFFKNSCAISYKCGKPEFVGTMGSNKCISCWCPKEHRHMCESNNEFVSSSDIKKLSEELKRLGLSNITDFSLDKRKIRVNGELSHEQVAYLSQYMGKRLEVERILSNHEWGGYVLGHTDLEI